jgi:ABC-type antimicrobial peptide transport system permease subunit
MAQWLRAEIHRMDPSLPVDIATLEQRVGKLAQRPKFSAMLLAFFAVTALVSAAVGLYGLVSFFVVQRTREIGMRMSLGATPLSIVRLVLRHAAVWAMAGLLIGMGGATLMAGTLQSLLFHVGSSDPLVLCVVTVLLLAVALLAAWIPARRAARVDPLIALRNQ